MPSTSYQYLSGMCMCKSDRVRINTIFIQAYDSEGVVRVKQEDMDLQNQFTHREACGRNVDPWPFQKTETLFLVCSRCHL